MKIKRYIILILIMICSIMILTGCDNKKDDTKELKDKSNSELAYFEQRISGIINEVLLKEYENNTKNLGENTNSQNNNTQAGQENNENNQNNAVNQGNNQQTKEINWEQLNKEIEKLYSSWSIFAIDLNKLNVDNQEIIAFGENINTVKLAIETKQENMALEALTNLYSYIPKYLSSYSEDSFEIAKKNIKYYILNAGVFAKSERWDECLSQIEKAESDYINLMNNVNYVNKNSYNVNKIYILIEELKNSVSYKNKDVFILKYKTLINEF